MEGFSTDKAATDPARQQAKDIAYTINHAFACTGWDVGGIPVMTGILKKIGVKDPHLPGCTNPFHDHAHHEHTVVDRNLGGQHTKTLAKMFAASEIIGDFAGVAPTVLMQRYTPWAMDGVRPLLRVTLGPIFHWGAENSTRKWAKKNGVAADSTEYKQHVEAIYEHEMHHLPQAAWWTAWATGLNLASQQLCYKAFASPEVLHHYPLDPLGKRIIAKLGGASFSIAMVLGARALFPETANRWTNWTDENLITPLTKTVAGTIGIDAKAVDEAVAEKKKYHDGNWSTRVAADSSKTQISPIR